MRILLWVTRLTFEKPIFLLYHIIINESQTVFGFSLMLSLEPFIIRLSEKEEIDMAQNRVRIADVADALGLSTATVSKGK